MFSDHLKQVYKICFDLLQQRQSLSIFKSTIRHAHLNFERAIKSSLGVIVRVKFKTFLKLRIVLTLPKVM